MELNRLVRLLLSRVTGACDERATLSVLHSLKRDLPPDYHWPGNVRELEHAERRILLTGHYHGERRVQGADAEQSLIEGVQTGSLTK